MDQEQAVRERGRHGPVQDGCGAQSALTQARTRTYLGAAAVVASVFVPQQCGLYSYNCRRVEDGLKELSDSFQNEVAPQVVDLEGQTLRLTGTAEEQYREWRRLLHQMYLEENGGLTMDATPSAAVPLPQAQPLALEPAN